MRPPVAALLMTLLTAALPAAGLNWLVNGDFSQDGAWEQALERVDGPPGMRAAGLSNDAPRWRAYRQDVALTAPAPRAIEVSGWMTAQGVRKGDQDWQVARITVVFFDAQGVQVGGWPAAVASADGDAPWRLYANQYEVPPTAARAQVCLLLDTCTGSAAWAGLRMLVFDHDGKPLAAGSRASHPGLAQAAAPETDNWLRDPGFEEPGSRDWNLGAVWPEGHDSLHSLHFYDAQPKWDQARQSVGFNGQHPATVLVAAWIRTQGVEQGRETWETARLIPDFHDAQGKQLGGWQAAAASLTGTSDWKRYERSYPVPPGAEGVALDLGMGNCRGEAWFDDVELKLLDAGGKALRTRLVGKLRTDTSGWWAVTPPARADGTRLDLAWMNDKPAGSRGFVTVKGGHFATADGARLRFWGTDLVGPSHFMSADADALLARRLARLGVNLVRLHMPDAAWSEQNLFTTGADNTLTLDPARLDQLDALVAALKAEGIYVYVDWMVARRFRPGDGVMDANGLEDGAKGAIHFDPRIIELEKLYATQLLGHKNPYLGHPLAADPCYLASEIINESSILSGFGEQKMPESYWAELQEQFHAAGNAGPLTRFSFDWDTQRLKPVLNADNAAATLAFLHGAWVAQCRSLKSFQRKLSPHGLLAGSNMGLPVLADLDGDAKLDYMDTHAYWDHPQVWNIPGSWSDIAHAPFDDRAQLKAPFEGSLLFNLSQAAVEGKPLLVTEWNDCFPNQYRLEGPVLMAAYASLQDWDGLLQFASTAELPGAVALSQFNINTRPDNEALYQLGALVFRRGLLKAAPLAVVEPVSDAQVLGGGSRSDWLFEHPWLPLAVKVAKRFTGAKAQPLPALDQAQAYDHPDQQRVDSSSGELSLDYGAGRLRVDSPQVQGFAGALGGAEGLETAGLRLSVDAAHPWAGVLAASLDGKPLAQSRRLMLVAVGRCENTGQTYAPDHHALRDLGGLPVLMEGLSGRVGLRLAPGAWSVRPLDADGAPGAAVAASQSQDWLELPLLASTESPVYLIEAAPAR
jgi:hypothetical protein